MITKIYNSTAVKRFTNIFSARGGDNRLATLADLNQVVDEVNANTGSVNHTILINQSGTSAPTRKYMATGDTDNCKSNCLSSGAGCVCDCTKDCTNEFQSSTNMVWTYNGVGDYTLTASFLGSVYAKGIFNVAVFVSPGQSAGDIINVTPSSNTAKTIWTFRFKTIAGASSALANGVLNGAFANIQVYTY